MPFLDSTVGISPVAGGVSSLDSSSTVVNKAFPSCRRDLAGWRRYRAGDAWWPVGRDSPVRFPGCPAVNEPYRGAGHGSSRDHPSVPRYAPSRCSRCHRTHCPAGHGTSWQVISARTVTCPSTSTSTPTKTRGGRCEPNNSTRVSHLPRPTTAVGGSFGAVTVTSPIMPTAGSQRRARMIAACLSGR